MPAAAWSSMPITTMDDFLWRALAGGIGAALIAGPLGAFVVWQRMAFFGDALAHSALLGVALGFLLDVNLSLGIVAVCLVVAALLVTLQGRGDLPGDTLIGIFAYSALSLGLVVVAFMDRLRVDLMSYLFGDILAISVGDLVWIYGGGAVVLAGLAWLWRPLLAVTVHEELARVEGIPADRMRLAFVCLLAIVIAISMKIVGILLITSLLIVPAAAARRFAGTPEAMAIGAAVIGAVAVAGGMLASATLDTPSGPSIVVAAAVIFAASSVWPRRA
jgi:zinc transport system permease protein